MFKINPQSKTKLITYKKNMSNHFELIDGGEGNPYHFFIYMLANFRTCDCRGDVYYYYPNKKDCKLSEEALSLLPPNFHRHLVKEEGKIYKPFLHVKPFFPDWTLPIDYDFLRSLFQWHRNPEKIPGLKIYVSRNKDATDRHVVNEDQLLPLLQKHNFLVVHMSDLQVKDQIHLFSCADVIMSPHGAALTFSIFCHPSVSIIEFMPNLQEKRHFSHIAWYFNYDYHKIIANVVDHTKQHLQVPIEEVESYLQYHPKTKI